jgi:hypothetical protein
MHELLKTKKENIPEVKERIIRPKHSIIDATIEAQEQNKQKRMQKGK